MNGPTLRIKSKRWHPAGNEWRQALTVLSDGAFKLFALICLDATREGGMLAFRQAELASALGKSRRSVGAYLAELQRKGVCVVSPSPNQHADGVLEVCRRYWPYEPCFTEPSRPDRAADPDEYQRTIREWLSRPCVRCGYSATDRRLAASWQAEGVSLEDVEQAILLGCGRKYVSWLNGGGAEPVGSLHYFTPILQEVRQNRLSPEYRDFNRMQVKRLERRWLAAQQKTRGQDPACEKLAQAPPHGEETR